MIDKCFDVDFIRFNKIEGQRLEALARQDGENYYRLCNYNGIEPEDVYLYEQGNADYLLKYKK